MAFVGGFPGLNAARRRTVRAPVNPMDKATVVSIFPKKLNEIKHTIEPGRFIVESGTFDKPAILVVGPSSWWKEIDDEQPLLEIPNSSIQVADSIVRDYCNGMLACNMADSMPGLFWIPGEFTVLDIQTKHKPLLIKANENQMRYFQALTKLADSLWARTNGNPLTISDDMRMAAKYLNLGSKDWMKDFTMSSKTSCPACGSPRDAAFPVCPNCKAIIDHDKAKTLGLKFAE
jgi:hypothetical protein